MTSWVVGDIHGCAEEFARLLDELALGEQDQLVCLGNLFHRGPDPAGVLSLLERHGARFVLGQHELAVLRRLGMAPSSADPSDRPPYANPPLALAEAELVGEQREPCNISPAQRTALVRCLQEHSGFFLRANQLPHSGPTEDGRDWVCVHAGVVPELGPEESPIEVLTRMRRLKERGRPWWYEIYAGPDLVLFGHSPSKLPRVHEVRGRKMAIGLDTGCVYGGRLTAYSPEQGEFKSVAAVRAWARI